MKFFLHNSISRSMKAAMLLTGLVLATSGLFAQGSGADLGKLNELAYKPSAELASTIAA